MKKGILFALILAVAGTAQAEVLPAEQWNDEVALWLARAMVSEADWHTPDHVAIAWVLKRRWEAASKDKYPTFLDMVKQYCAGMRGKTRTSRHVWTRALTDDGTEPEGWPANVSWSSYRPHWGRVLRLARAWGRGEVQDPCKGKAWQWGGPMDRPGVGWRTVNCGMTANIFYTHK
jgi:hypothetical protein